MKHLPTYVKHQIIALRTAGLSLNAICTQLSLKKSTIRNVLKKFSVTGTVNTSRRSGRPRTVSSAGERALFRMAVSTRRKSCAQLRESFNVSRTRPVSSRTIRRILHRHKIFGRAAAKKLCLSPWTRTVRLQWCKTRRNLDVQNYWKRVIFSDEVRFSLRSDGRVWVWRRPGERFLPQCTTGRNTSRQSLMYWGFITWDGTGVLIRCSNRMTATEYCEKLEQSCIQVATSEFDQIIMDDNAPIHRSRLVKSWMEDNSVTSLQWPPYSPDLNPIEDLWAYIKNTINRNPHPPTSVEMLDAAVQEIWENTRVSFIQRLYNSIPQRIRHCIKNCGFPTKY
jgi:transposase